MTKQWFLMAATAVLLLAGPASALSIQHSDNTNTDGTAKFADPDEQTPAGLVSPDSVSTGNAMNMAQPPSLTAPYTQQPVNMDQGRSSFDNAYNHVSNQH